MKDGEVIVGNIWVYISIGLAVCLLLPEVDFNNDKPIYIATQHYETKDGYSHVVKVKYSNMSRLRYLLNHRDFGIYDHYTELYFDTKTKDEYWNKIENIQEDMLDASTNLKFLSMDEFELIKHKPYAQINK